MSIPQTMLQGNTKDKHPLYKSLKIICKEFMLSYFVVNTLFSVLPSKGE